MIIKLSSMPLYTLLHTHRVAYLSVRLTNVNASFSLASGGVFGPCATRVRHHKIPKGPERRVALRKIIISLLDCRYCSLVTLTAYDA